MDMDGRVSEGDLDDSAAQPRPADGDESATVVHEVDVSTRTMVRAVGVVLATIALLWAADAARSLVSMLVISAFFALALLPGVILPQRRRWWRRGAAVGVIYLVGAIT